MTKEETKFYTKLGKLIRTHRKESNISQHDLSIKTGILQSGLSRIESGSSHITSWQLYKISKALKVDLLLMG